MRILLYPLAILYQAITAIRNYLYNNGIKKVYRSPITTIIVGNLSTGGTGKTPHTAWLLNQFLNQYRMVTLSRGYKRKTSGYIPATIQSNALEIGDEPMEYVQQFPQVQVTVGENRVDAVKRIEQDFPQTDLIILDDAFQHRPIDGHLKILLTTFQNPFYKDYILPVGNLRESSSGAERADYIIITKCPETIDKQTKNSIVKAINPRNNQQILFSYYRYKQVTTLFSEQHLELDKNKTIVVISGIANPHALIDFFKDKKLSVVSESFKDHFEYTEPIIKTLLNKYPESQFQLVLTRKDAVKWQLYPSALQNRTIGIVDIEVVFHDAPAALIQNIQNIIQHNNEQRSQ